MNAATETSLDALTLTRNARQLRAEDKGRRRRMAIRRRPARKGGLGSALWWVWPISWATILSTVCFATDVWQDTLYMVLVNAGY
ncbi:MAG: hypothetical protein QGI63_03650 [Rhodospirillales bacterium]|jgi:hypothetical protein|nr:hypothetical protein [Rhodospirillales bacterium]MDP6773344.1 hypothetical protein [Rhodospirillales bacterium]